MCCAGGSEEAAAGPAAAPDGRTVHAGVQCDGCGAAPLLGVRHRSLRRPNYDLCGRCAARPDAEQRDGPFERSGLDPTSSAHGGGGGGGSQAAGGGAEQQQQQPELPAAPWWVDASRRQGKGVGGGGGRGGGGAAQPAASRPPTPLQEALLSWVWAYFTGGHAASREMHSGAAPAGGGGGGPCACRVALTGMPPLYFQHAGHSRTIVGIERWAAPAARGGGGEEEEEAGGGARGPKRSRRSPPGEAGEEVGGGAEPFDARRWVYRLLILDPSTSPEELADSLRHVVRAAAALARPSAALSLRACVKAPRGGVVCFCAQARRGVAAAGQARRAHAARARVPAALRRAARAALCARRRGQGGARRRAAAARSAQRRRCPATCLLTESLSLSPDRVVLQQHVSTLASLPARGKKRMIRKVRPWQRRESSTRAADRRASLRRWRSPGLPRQRHLAQ